MHKHGNRYVLVFQGSHRFSTVAYFDQDDLGGTLMDETISRMAGSDHGVRQDPESLRAVAVQAGRIPAERTTDYSRIEPLGIRYRIAS